MGHLVLTPGSGRAEVSTVTCSALERITLQTLVVTYWFEAAEEGEPRDVEVRFVGRLRGERTGAGATTFVVTHRAPAVIPGSGRVALTVRVPDLATGDWEVSATPVSGGRPWREETVTTLGRTSEPLFAPALGPRLRLGAWPAMVAAGATLGLALLGILAARVGLPGPLLVMLSVLASVLGIGGAKAYYLVTHPGERTAALTVGLSLQGFVIAALTTVVLGAALLGLRVGAVLDVTAPALLLGQAVGRLGCLMGGCCVGRPTASRWGLWLSDRTIGVRRIPVQLLESAAALGLALASSALILAGAAAPAGLVFVAALGAYLTTRQLLFPLRHIPRATRHGRRIVLGVSAAASVAAILGLVLA